MSQQTFVQKETDEFIARISEHCDAIRVFIAMPDDKDSTETYTCGYGNWFCQYGLVNSWLVEQNTRISRRASKKEDSSEGTQ